MTQDHLTALLKASEAKKDSDGWYRTPEGRNLTLYAAFNGASLNVGRIEMVRVKDDLVEARTIKGELFMLSLSDVYAGAVEAPKSSSRRAGFAS